MMALAVDCNCVPESPSQRDCCNAVNPSTACSNVELSLEFCCRNVWIDSWRRSAESTRELVPFWYAPMEIRSSACRRAARSCRNDVAALRCSRSVISVITRDTLARMSIAGKWPCSANFRFSTTWPSSVPLTASAIGSFMSSPSTRTEKIPVMLPEWVRPHRSSNFGRRANTLGGYPRVAGASPAARPISRCACANRVTLSITSSTSRPVSRKYSAMAVPRYAARSLTTAGSSPVATTTTL